MKTFLAVLVAGLVFGSGYAFAGAPNPFAHRIARLEAKVARINRTVKLHSRLLHCINTAFPLTRYGDTGPVDVGANGYFYMVWPNDGGMPTTFVTSALDIPDNAADTQFWGVAVNPACVSSKGLFRPAASKAALSR